MKKSKDKFLVKVGDIVTVDVLEWYHEDYEFSRPCLMLSPVIREDSDSNPESMIERLLIDLITEESISFNNQQDQVDWRGWNLKYLRRCFDQALKGKEFPVAGYTATRKVFKVIWDKKEKWFDWEEVK